MSERKVCTYCGKEGHRAHRCPSREHASPWSLLDALVAALVVAMIAGGLHA